MAAILFDSQASTFQDFTEVLPGCLPDGGKALPVAGGAVLHAAVARLAADTSQCTLVLNLCSGHDCSGGVSAHMAALLLEQLQLSYSGCRAALLARPLDVLFMMTWYAGLPMPPFAVVNSVSEAVAASERLSFPLVARGVLPFAGTASVGLRDRPSTEGLSKAFSDQSRLVLWEASAALRPDGATEAHLDTAYALVSGGHTRGALTVGFAGALERADAEAAESKVRAWAQQFSKDVLYHCGTALLTFTRRTEPSGGSKAEPGSAAWRLGDISLNPSLTTLPAAVRGSLDAAKLLADMTHDALMARATPNYEVRLNSDSRKGYFLCAGRAIKKGEVIFEDECRSFAMVTRPHVEQHWDADLKKTFTEYAWPLDADGHLYAIWEKEPTRWRPINHSCDPTCIFEVPHSLNVIAARDIAPGDDLSMDYTTFCDHTMRPFQCLCGASSCRGWIIPDEATLAKYGAHAWLRRVPPPVKPLL